MKKLDNCPNCNASLIGDPIPADIVDQYAGTHWRREIGIVNRDKYDGISYWQCPDCKYMWNRWTGKEIKLNLGRK